MTRGSPGYATMRVSLDESLPEHCVAGGRRSHGPRLLPLEGCFCRSVVYVGKDPDLLRARLRQYIDG